MGRHASAGTDWKLDTEILTYSRAKGGSAGLALEGGSIRQAMIPGTTSSRAELSQKQVIAHKFGQNTPSSIRILVRGIAFGREHARSSKETIYAGSEAGKVAFALGTRLEAPFGVRTYLK